VAEARGRPPLQLIKTKEKKEQKIFVRLGRKKRKRKKKGREEGLCHATADKGFLDSFVRPTGDRKESMRRFPLPNTPRKRGKRGKKEKTTDAAAVSAVSVHLPAVRERGGTRDKKISYRSLLVKRRGEGKKRKRKSRNPSSILLSLWETGGKKEESGELCTGFRQKAKRGERKKRKGGGGKKVFNTRSTRPPPLVRKKDEKF